jgi:iron-sulfur cluster protein
MSESRADKAARIRHLLETEGDAVYENTTGFNEGRYETTGQLENYEELKDEARAVKEDAIERLPDLIDQLRETVEANGGTVYIADDAADANEYVAEVCDDADRLVKSKSMTSEEIEVNEHLEARGVDVLETDLGEYVLQVAEEAPSHIVAPGIHKSRESISQLFEELFDPDGPLETAEDLTKFARHHLAEKLRDADVAMTGANFLTADTGTMALVTSEGNARKCVASTDTHIAVAGVEKVIPTFEDLQPFIELIGRSGTGQDITSYISLLTPPVDTPTLDFPEGGEMGDGDDREFHLVLIDNGRFEMRDDPQLRETLYCIRCSACLNSCANFQQVGGHAFGGDTYSGGIGTGWEYATHGEDSAAEFNDMCTGCSRCVNQCPVKIDIPWINTVIRNRINQGEDPSQFEKLVDGLVPDEEPEGTDLRKRAFGNIDTLATLAGETAPVSNWLAETPPARSVMERVLGIDTRRDLPEFKRETLVKWAQGREGPADPDRTVVLYPDLYTNRVLVERGKAAVRALEALGIEVVVPSAGESGRAPLSQGMIDTAQDHAEDTYETLEPYLDVDHDVVVVEPSDLAMFRNEYEKLLPEDDYERLRSNSYEVVAYIEAWIDYTADPDPLAAGDGEAVAYHSHCQQRTMGLEGPTVDLLEDLGYDVLTSDVECCGMAGSFGYKSEYYDLSMAVGEPLQEQFQTAEAADRTVVASGTSCTEQLGDLLGREPTHPVELIAPDE